MLFYGIYLRIIISSLVVADIDQNCNSFLSILKKTLSFLLLLKDSDREWEGMV